MARLFLVVCALWVPHASAWVDYLGNPVNLVSCDAPAGDANWWKGCTARATSCSGVQSVGSSFTCVDTKTDPKIPIPAVKVGKSAGCRAGYDAEWVFSQSNAPGTEDDFLCFECASGTYREAATVFPATKDASFMRGIETVHTFYRYGECTACPNPDTWDRTVTTGGRPTGAASVCDCAKKNANGQIEFYPGITEAYAAEFNRLNEATGRPERIAAAPCPPRTGMAAMAAGDGLAARPRLSAGGKGSTSGGARASVTAACLGWASVAIALAAKRSCE